MIALTLIVLVISATCVSLGFWQIARLGQAQAARSLALTRGEGAAVPFETVVGLDVDPQSVVFRQVIVEGEFLLAEEIAITNRTRHDQAGSDIVTPLVLADGSIVLVRRGWVPVESATPPVRGAEPPQGPVTVRGALVQSEPRLPFTPPFPDGTLRTMSRLDIQRISEQLDAPVAPVAIVATDVTPSSGRDLPVPIELDLPSEGPHRSYAGQWFLFALIALVTYGFLLRRSAHEEPH